MKAPYIFDSSSMRVLGNYYPDQFPSFWQRFEEAAGNGQVISVREVYNELELQVSGKWIWKWVQDNKALFPMPKDQETQFLGEIFKVPHFRALVGELQRLKGRPVADPFVVASARVCGGCVVTEEAKKPNAAKIPTSASTSPSTAPTSRASSSRTAGSSEPTANLAYS